MTGPAVPHGAEEMREALTDALVPYMHADDRTEARDPALAARLSLRDAERGADAVLALPAVQDALAAQEAVKRVERLLPEIEVMDQRDSGEDIANMIRDALDGSS